MDYDTDAARQALEAHFDSESGASSQPAEQSVPSGVEQPEQQGATEQTPDSFTSIDPNTLAPELQEIYKSMQGDYTRKLQDVSSQRREFETLGGLDKVREAVSFVDALQDPNNLVQLHGELSEYLQSQGLTKAQADAEATSQIQDTQTGASDPEWEFTDPQTEALKRELDAIKAQNQDLSKWRDEFEQQRQLQEVEAALARQETAIRQQNPHYTDEDINSIYAYSYAFGGDLGRAQAAFEHEKQRILSSYMQQKQSVPAGATPPATAGSAQTPQTFGRDLEAAHDYAKRKALAELAQLDL